MSTIDLPVIDNRPEPTAPSSLVVRYGYLRLIGEFPYDSDTRPGCGARVVIRTRRGTEIAKVLATTCTNSDCSKSLPREQLLSYISNSGGNDFPYNTDGRVLRIATPEDLAQQARLDVEKAGHIAACKQLIRELDLPMKLIDVEILLGGEMVTFFFGSEHRVDFRGLVRQLAAQFHTRIQMHQVGSRDEARLVADYETCGRQCCCREFLKILKPVNMGSAKVQKATLDPNKISGRCGRLKCCLRYEDATYDELRRRLPRVGAQVLTADGPGVVVEGMILTQLVKVRLESNRFIAVAIEDLLHPNAPVPPKAPSAEPAAPRPERNSRRSAASPAKAPAADEPDNQQQPASDDGEADTSRKRRRRRSRRRPVEASGNNAADPAETAQAPAPRHPKPPKSPKPQVPSSSSASAGSGSAAPGTGTPGRRRRGRSRTRNPQPPVE